MSNEYNHNKSQCVFAHYYLTGDLRTLDNIKLMMNNGYANRAADRGWAWRGIGAQLALLWQSYELTLDEKYRTRAAGMAKRAWSGRARSQSFYGIALEGVVYYHWMTGDPAAKAGLLKMIGDRRDGGPTKALGLAYAYYLTGEDSYRQGALKALGRPKYTPRPKNFGMLYRNAPFAWYYVSNIKNKRPAVKEEE